MSESRRPGKHEPNQHRTGQAGAIERFVHRVQSQLDTPTQKAADYRRLPHLLNTGEPSRQVVRQRARKGWLFGHPVRGERADRPKPRRGTTSAHRA